MSNMPKDLDVAKRAKVIEWLKTEVVDNVSRLFKALWEGSTAKVGDSLASLMMSSYILGRRLGMSYRDLDDLLIEKLKKHKQEGHQLEDWYQDISTLEEHLRKR
ncbi:MazG-like family protein [Paenibacillus uliginis N3/975]|uniref:MazG-like family protein n=2 Tax=Paenibacillus TaxID=44249 RepID=A0A1X7HTR6_9BACL|nr:MazG-like family protein [Paenibacillus uliginis N3/975]